MRIGIKRLSIILSMVLLFSAAIINKPTEVLAAGNTYYVDSVSGVDSNNGLSQTAAWKTVAKVSGTTFMPGDKILFKAGGTWSGELWPKGSGASGSPIIIDMYGTGNKPAFIGSQTSNQTFRLDNQKYWEINNLDISANYTNSFTRRGVYVHASDIGVVEHLYFKNLEIHDVYPNIAHTNNNTAKDTGGMFFSIDGGAVATKFNDLLISGCTIRDLDREGITLAWSTWSNRTGETGGAGPWTGSTNVVVRNNTFRNIGGDGIVAQTLQSPLIEYNTIDGFCTRNYNVSYNAGMWAYSSDDAVFQYNEAYNGKTTKDGMAWDADARTNRTIFQYNYSHDNEGGAMLFISYGTEYSRDAVFRYNISQNDRNYLITSTAPINAKVYNNVFYTGSGVYADIFNTRSGTAEFKNNIFYNKGTTVGANWGPYSYDYNTFFGNYSTTPNDSHKLTTDPQFVNPGTGTIGRNTLDGYKLKNTSPSMNSGVSIANNSGKDFWGNPLYFNTPDRGAFESQSAAVLANLSKGILATSGSTVTNAAMATDGNTTSSNYAALADGLQWLQVDLGKSYNVSNIKLWHYYADSRTYRDVIVQVSNDPSFQTGVTTVFNNDTNNSAGKGTGTDAEYAETSGGKDINFNAVNARYVRAWSNGSTANTWNHVGEIQVFGTPTNLSQGTLPTSGSAISNAAMATDGNTSSNNFAGLADGLQWLQLDLGKSYNVSNIKLWHYVDGRTYRDVIVQVSNDPNFQTGVTTVFNNDTNNSAGKGIGTDAEYSETSAGKDITFNVINARYVRAWSNGNSLNVWNHVGEIQVYGTPAN